MTIRKQEMSAPPNGKSNPDPTQLTTEQLFRETGSTKEQLKRDNKALRELLEARLNAGDKAIELLQRTADKIPNDMAKAIEGLQDLHSQRSPWGEAPRFHLPGRCG